MNDETRHTLIETSRPVRWAAAAALAMLALFLVVKTFDALARFGDGENPPVNTITVSGEGRSTATPDIAKVSFTVSETAADVKTAQDAATKKSNEALAALKTLGIDEKDLKTQDYSVTPQYAQEQSPCPPNANCMRVATANKIIGYQVSESIYVTVRDTEKVGEVVTKLGTLNVQNISGPEFSVDDDEGVMSEARAAAIENAREKAKELAKELGVSLGDVVSYSDQGGYNPYMSAKGGVVMDSAMSEQMMPSLPVGTDERTVTVMVTYRIR